MLNALRPRASYANVASTLALILAVGTGGAAVAAGLVPAKSVGSKQIINGAVRTADLHAGAVTGPKIRKGAVGTPKIRNGSVTAPKIQDGSISGDEIQDDAVTHAHIQDGTITGAEIQEGAIYDHRVFGEGSLGVVRGYVLNDSPLADADLTGKPSTYNSAGGAVTVDRKATGTYEVTFAGLDLTGTVVQVSSTGLFPAWCMTGDWSVNTAQVWCFNPAGAPADTGFTLAVID